MSKSCRIVVPESSTSSSRQAPRVTDWTLCVICQQDTTKKITNPAVDKYRGSGKECGYRLLAENLLDFHKVNCLPPEVAISRLDSGNGVANTLMENNAVWHKTCRNKFDSYKLKRAQKRKAKEEAEEEPSPVKTRQRSVSMTRNNNCFFCDADDGKEKLHSAQTDKIDQRVREYAHILQDRLLLGKLSEGDMHALDARYHSSCMTLLSNRVRKHQNERMRDSDKSKTNSLVLAELVAYIEEFRNHDSESLPVFKLSDLGKLYESRLKEQDPHFSGKVNTTRLKEKLLGLIPNLRTQTQGRDVILMFDSDIGEAIKLAWTNNHDDDAMQLASAARILRKDIFSEEYTFEGSMEQGCEIDAVPESLLAFLRMILYGPNIKNQAQLPEASTKVAVSLSELISFNAKKYSQKAETSGSRHAKSRENPLVIYTGLMIHAKTRQKALVDKLSQRGLCISYDRVKEINANLANSVCAQFDRDGCVCPSTLKKNIFTVGAVDNIDHNPSARNAMDSFHGTAISIIQFPTHEKPGEDREPITMTDIAEKDMKCSLPSEYSEIEPATISRTELFPPASDGNKTADVSLISASREKENEWLTFVSDTVMKAKLEPEDFISWSAYHASKQSLEIRPSCPIALLPLFTEPAASVAMIAHSMKLVDAVVQHLNTGQIPIVTMDQPLFGIAKQIQWAWPDVFGEDKFVVLMGGLHIEMNAVKLLGDFLRGSGWAAILIKSGVTTSGRADAILKGSHVTRCRYVHQVTAASLHLLRISAYQSYSESLSAGESGMDFKTWCDHNVETIPQFKYWSLVLELELLVLQFVRSLREADFLLYVQCLGQLVPWMFAMDHTNYARWLPIHIKDMVQLQERVPSVHQEFLQGNFVVQKSNHVFSNIAIDQAHEQMNAMIKGDGGVVGITQNPTALLKWITAGPEIARLTEEYESSFGKQSSGPLPHHDQGAATQQKFSQHVKSMVETIEDIGNPFKEDSKDLVVLDTKEVMSAQALENLNSVKSRGEYQYEKFVDERIERRTTPVSDIISKNNLSVFHKVTPNRPSRTSHQIKTLKSSCELYGRMYISCQSRDGDMDEFFSHENQAEPPSLSDMGEMRHCTKSDLVGCLEKMIDTNSVQATPTVDAKILDGSVLVNMLLPKSCTTFEDYRERVFFPYLIKCLSQAKRVDVVWDRYVESSLKSQRRQQRGAGTRVIVRGSTPIPQNWQSFLRVDQNKTELYKYLSDSIAKLSVHGKEIYSTQETGVVSSEGGNVGHELDCDHEEADSRILLHAAHCVRNGHRKILIRTVDTDVVVLAVATFHTLSPDEMWVAFGLRNHYRMIPIHEMARALGEERSKALLFFHCFTGCDTSASFCSIGKKKAWDTWTAYPEVTETFLALSQPAPSVSEENMRHLERFVILLYDRSSDSTEVNQARKSLFAKGRQIDHIPPTKAALLEHAKRSTYQAGYVWGRSLEPMQNLPSPNDWGWTRDANNQWTPFWTALPEAAKSCKELVKCNCKKACRVPCKCVKSSLQCTELCKCGGTCYRMA